MKLNDKNLENGKVKDYIILYYQKLLESAVKREDYETAIKYKKWIEKLEKSGEK